MDIWGLVALLVLVGGIVWGLIRMGRRQERGAAAKKGLERANESRKRRQDISGLSDDDLADRMRKYER